MKERERERLKVVEIDAHTKSSLLHRYLSRAEIDVCYLGDIENVGEISLEMRR
jgi:hypothetical protein